MNSPTAEAALQLVLPGDRCWPLHDSAATRRLEASALAAQPAPQALMQRAGLATARLALALAPHAARIDVVCGPGNNGGDGLVAARHLHAAGKAVRVCLLANAHDGSPRLPADAQVALTQAQAAGVAIVAALPERLDGDLLLDALLGLGARRAPEGELAAAITGLNAARAPVLAIDLPSGLHPDTGAVLGAEAVRARHTLSLLTLKPGLFTGFGRDHTGAIWFDDLGTAVPTEAASAGLSGADSLHCVLAARAHATHKGSFGDVLVVGGAPGMAGAALLAASSALAAGAGRVYLSPLDAASPALDPLRPELMHRPAGWRPEPAWLRAATVVCGCGGGDAVRATLPLWLAHADRLVLDADALNAVAAEPMLQQALQARGARQGLSVLTPHPLEAARLLGIGAGAVQADRVGAARELAARYRCIVVLKGSGTVIAAPEPLAPGAITINPTGNAMLASAGTGDVLAGWVGGLWSRHAGSGAAGSVDAASTPALEAAIAAVWLHGHAADLAAAAGSGALPLRAADLIEAMRRAALFNPV